MNNVNLFSGRVKKMDKRKRKAEEARIRSMIELAQEYNITYLDKDDLCPGVAYLLTDGFNPVSVNLKATDQIGHLQAHILLSVKSGFRYEHFLHPFNPIRMETVGEDGIAFEEIDKIQCFLPLYLMSFIEVSDLMTVYGFYLEGRERVIRKQSRVGDKIKDQLPKVFQVKPTKPGIEDFDSNASITALYAPQLKEVGDHYTAEWREI